MSDRLRRASRLLVVPLVVAIPLALGLPAVAAAKQSPATAGAYIVLFHGDVNTGAKASQLQKQHGVHAKKTYDKSVRGLAANLDSAQVSELRSDPDVALVAPDLPVHATSEVGLSAGDSVPTGVRRIGAGSTTTARQASTANVAVIDTGVDLTNPDLNVSAGTDCTGTGSANDDEGHGTHVAGTIAAKNNGSGVVGVAPGTHIDAVKVLDSTGSGSYDQIICGIDWVAGTRTDADPTNDVSVANLSFGGDGQALDSSCSTTTDALRKAICGATADGVLFVAAAGNDTRAYDTASSSGGPDAPAEYPEVLTVTAAADSDGAPGGTGGSPSCWGGSDDVAASFSDWASSSGAVAHTIAAPGVCITSDAPGGGTAVMSGTSMATPHVVGAVALCLGEAGVAGPCAGLTPAQIIAKMRGDAASRTTAVPSYGFTGDPAHGVSGRYYGYLTWSGAASTTAAPAPPTVTSVSPTDNKVAVPLNSPVTVTFSKAMDQASSQAAFSLVRSTTGATIPGSFSWSGNTMTFIPSAALVAGAVYNAKVATTAHATDGSALSTARTWAFRGVLTTHVTPSTVTVSGGTYRSGSASSLTADDSLFYVVGSTTTGPTAAFYGTASANNDIQSLSWAYAGKDSATATQVLSLWNWTTSRWVAVDARTVGTALLTLRGDAAGTMADYVSGTSGAGSIRFQVRSTRSSTFTLSGGRMALQFTR